MFYRAHLLRTRRLAAALTGDAHAAADIAQEVLIRVWQRAADIDRIEAYLRAATVNACRNWQRAESRRRVREARVSVMETQPTPVEDGATAVEVALVLEALAGLPFRQRAAVACRVLYDLPDAEIAAALGCAVATVRVSVHRGLRRLRKQLDEHGGR